MRYAIAQMTCLTIGHIFMKSGFLAHHPFHFLVLMYGVACLIIGISIACRPALMDTVKALRPHWKTVAFLMVLFLVNCVAFFLALHFLGLSGVSALGRLTPIMMMVSGVLLFGEKLDRWQIALIGITLPCTLIFSIDGEGFALHPLGLIGILTASLTWVAINIIIKKSGALMNGPGLIIIRTPFLCLTFVAGYTIFLWLGSVPALTLDISAFDLLIITGAALCLPILPYALFPLVLKYTDLSTMAVLGAIQPLVAFFAGLVLFGETTDAIRMTAALIGIGAGILYAVHIVIKNPKINRPD